MMTLIASFLGLLTSAFPDVLKMFRDAQDRKHELTILQMQMQQQAQGHSERLEEINVQADIAEMNSLANRVPVKTGVLWVDALNGTVRPVITYAFFLLYAYIKVQQAIHTPWMLWAEEDQAIFAAIISFYFGQRAMSKVRARHG